MIWCDNLFFVPVLLCQAPRFFCSGSLEVCVLIAIAVCQSCQTVTMQFQVLSQGLNAFANFGAAGRS